MTYTEIFHYDDSPSKGIYCFSIIFVLLQLFKKYIEINKFKKLTNSMIINQSTNQTIRPINYSSVEGSFPPGPFNIHHTLTCYPHEVKTQLIF